MSNVSIKEIANVIVDLSDSHKKDQLVNAVASYLIIERRTSELDKIMREVDNRLESTTGVVEVNVTSAFPINNAVKEQIQDILKLNKVIINETIDKSLIGGVRVETREQFLDLTLRSRLNKFKARSK